MEGVSSKKGCKVKDTPIEICSLASRSPQNQRDDRHARKVHSTPMRKISLSVPFSCLPSHPGHLTHLCSARGRTPTARRQETRSSHSSSPSPPSRSTPLPAPSKIPDPVPERLPLPLPPPSCLLSLSASRTPAVAAAGTGTIGCGEGCMRRRSGGDDCGFAIRSWSRWGKCG